MIVGTTRGTRQMTTLEPFDDARRVEEVAAIKPVRVCVRVWVDILHAYWTRVRHFETAKRPNATPGEF